MLRNNTFIIVICLVFSVLYSVLSIIHHDRFLSGGFDQGIFDQAIWQFAHFQYPYNTIKEKLILADHLSLTLPLLAPLYWFWDDVKIALIFQAVWISFSAFPIYKYLLLRKFTTVQSLLLSILYISFYGMQYLVFFDFHSVAIGVGLLAWVLYFWQAEKWRWFIGSVLLLLLTQENMGVALFGLCVFWFFQKKYRKRVLLLMGISIVYTLIAFLTIKLLAHGNLQYVPQFPNTLQEIFTRFFDTQDKRDVWLYSFSWYSFLPLFSPIGVFVVTLDLAQYFITGEAFNHMWSPYLHHRAILSIFLLLGTVDVLLFLKSKKLPITIITLLLFIVSLFLQWHFHFAINKLTKSEYTRVESWMRDNDVVLNRIPKNASVAAQQSLVPHLAHRQYIYLAYPRERTFSRSVCAKKTCWWLDFVGNPDYLVVDTHDTAWVTMLLADVTDFRQAVVNMENSHVITLVYKKNEAKLYKINHKELDKLHLEK